MFSSLNISAGLAPFLSPVKIGCFAAGILDICLDMPL